MRADSGVVETYDNIMLVSQLALNIPLTDAQAVVREMEHTESFMPLIDPTGWLRIRGTAQGHQRLAEAFLRFRSELEQIVAESRPAGNPAPE